MSSGLRLGQSDPRISWPVIVADGHDVMLFEDVHALAAKLEPADLDSWEVFDADARRLRLWGSGDQIALTIAGVEDVAALTSILRASLDDLGHRSVAGSLSDLLEALRHVVGFTR